MYRLSSSGLGRAFRMSASSPALLALSTAALAQPGDNASPPGSAPPAPAAPPATSRTPEASPSPQAPQQGEAPSTAERPATPSGEGGAVGFTIGVATTQKLKALAAAEGVTLFAVLLAAYQVLLLKLSGQRDLLVSERSLCALQQGVALAELVRLAGCGLGADLAALDRARAARLAHAVRRGHQHA